MGAAAIESRDALLIDVIVDSDVWAAHPQAETVVRQAIGAAASEERSTGEIAVMLTDDAAMQRMNAQWRGIDKPTNVLSFPAGAATPQHLGDIAIGCETVAREASAEDKLFLHHLAHLAIHGYLHLIGFDHETDEGASRMESLETRILSGLSIADPYARQTSAD